MRISLGLASLVWIWLSFAPVASGFDENYTLALLHHSYREVLDLDVMDVHPFLYYFLLKTFLKITTFYTNNPLVKVSFARFFSFLLLVTAFVYLLKISRLLGLKCHPATAWLLFLLLPGVLNASFMDNAQLTNIRMYSLAALLVVAEFYYLLKYRLTSRGLDLVWATVAALLGFYTHYYVIFLGGGLLLAHFVWVWFQHRLHQTVAYLLSGIVVLVGFVPWLPVMLHQARSSSTYWMNAGQEHAEFMNLFWVLLIFCLPVVSYCRRHQRFRQQLIMLSAIVGVTFLVTLVYSLAVGNAFQCRYLFPLLLIYEFLGVVIAWQDLCRHGRLFGKFVGVVIVILLLSESYGSFRGDNAITRTRTLATVDRPAEKVEHLSPRVASNHTDTTLLITNLIYRHQRISVPVRCKRTFQQHAHVYWNATYRKVFHSEIRRIQYRR